MTQRQRVQVEQPYLDTDPIAASARALFLDRDGVINLNHGYVHSAAQTEWVDGIFEFVRYARSRGFIPIVVTNQAGIARGYYTKQQFLDYTAWVHEQFRAREAALAATFYCPHHPQAGQGEYGVECGCRKPEPGMLTAALARFNVDPGRSVMIGDKPSDMDAARAAGVNSTILLSEDRGFDADIFALFDRNVM